MKLFICLFVAAASLSASTLTVVNYDPNAPEGNFSAPNATNDNVKYSITFGSNSTSIFGTISAMPAGQGNDNYNAGLAFANLYFGTGSSYNTGVDFGIEIENNRAFIPGGADGPQDLTAYGFTYSLVPGTGYPGGGPTVINFSLPFSYLMNDPESLGFNKLSAANPFIELRDSQSLSYTYVGGASFGTTRFGAEALPAANATPEPATWASMAGAGIAIVVARRKLKKA
jgi:hypothetical protein